ncbi:MAG TPA: bifunctional cobalt-precorrin-7 (C(5))-methyltransferase/cobalt-precorrin-6B (C(15))-methyltransferase [Chlorobaculum sp.]|uniref:Precorrin-6y c5,15-methyltransferase, decarboxylating n=1 Tax=Chlorobaculum tepidum (strain ATCC 49652 / DSM 12025 / NBRC 103806 / TLS) TaxID=194439 RepID=Q8KFE1_CHLTE|nr:bifunctional cobalt-precorrin-7 (C(5))-methyltransferase/cobalt-precorrin-6B (C(15))-methyltransferase [Chlorobaculum tepidum]AAM71632.1 precorrin-6y c5,15-methyltransferase, decarboxylating [Chlorobaculum tepidum TLS]HBU23858.1 bifunctional cobalt-precorrin-7 (C(5))-methyltransferase/cobalt-precorrin-6B (C(15))-methyltransferase [Chlorobaculum sp.]
MSEQFTLIGLSDSTEPHLDPSAIEAIRAHRIFAGGTRHREIVGALLPSAYRWITIAPPIDEVLSQLAGADEPVVVFASGDPFFYGFGATLQKRFPGASIQSFPTFHSLQMLAQRCLIPYQSMRHASLTGRSWEELDCALIAGERLIGVLTDTRKTPTEVARRMLDFGYSSYRMAVGESLGGSDERVTRCTLEEASGMQFGKLNCLLLEASEPPKRWFGIPENLFDGLPGRPNMITKMPFRLAALAALELGRARTFWDVGFCTGSVAIEARLRFPGLAVTAFEKRPECDALLEVNARRFGAPGIAKVMGDFLEQDHRALCGNDGVDAVFIGGHGDRLGELFAAVATHLAPGGRVVMNAVRRSSAEAFTASAARHGMELAEPLKLTVGDHNPVSVMKAVMPG